MNKGIDEFVAVQGGWEEVVSIPHSLHVLDSWDCIPQLNSLFPRAGRVSRCDKQPNRHLVNLTEVYKVRLSFTVSVLVDGNILLESLLL